jgi:putative protein-disulfide isomerase
MNPVTLYYIHDPMCSWCYAFKPVWGQLQQQLQQLMTRENTLAIVPLLGGLATDTDRLMSAEMRQQLQATWQRIEQKIPTIEFNYDFWRNWQHTHPRRATYPACRAVIAAHFFDDPSHQQGHYYQNLMIKAIQQAYYQQALNPSDESVLIQLAETLGLDSHIFQIQLHKKSTQQQLNQQIKQCQQMNVHSYPSLILQIDQSYWPISIDYFNIDSMLETIDVLLEY